MRSTRLLSITLPVEMAQMVKEKVASGDYASESEVIRDGLRALKERDSAVEAWLRNEVLPTLKAHEADPSRAIPIEEVFDGMAARYRAQRGRAE
jgi:putative addiction module CopG family antidote